MGEHFCLKWNNHQENLTGIMAKLLDEQKFIDVSIVCEMKTFKAHQTVLSACSPYFQQVLEENPHPHPIVILRDVKECEMSALLQYMYRGEVNVRDHELSAFLNTARALQIRGLSDNKKENTLINKAEPLQDSSPSPQNVSSMLPKRRRLSTSLTDNPNKRPSSDCEKSPSPLPIICKTNQTSKSSSSVSTSSYSDNMSDVHFADTLTPSAPPVIKQELDGTSTQSDEQFHGLTHHLPEKTVFPESPPSNKELTVKYVENDISRLDQVEINGSKPWNIKHLYDKVEGTGFKCRMCGHIIKHVRNHYLKHFPEHHECRLCRRTYTRRDNLNSHLKRDHLQRGKSARSESYPSAQKRGGKKYPVMKCYTPDVYSHLSYPDAGGSAPAIPSHPLPIPGPMDLSLRSTSAPIHTQHAQLSFSPIYDFLPSIYNYLRH